MGAHSTARRTAHAKGKHRAPSEQRIERYAWLGAGAVTLGIGAAMANGIGVASAETGTDGGSTAAGPQSPAAAQPPAGGGADGGAGPSKTPDTKPTSTVGSGREETDGTDPDEPGSDGPTRPSGTTGKGPVTSLSASGGNLKTEITGGLAKVNAVREKLAEKLAPARNVDADEGDEGAETVAEKDATDLTDPKDVLEKTVEAVFSTARSVTTPPKLPDVPDVELVESELEPELGAGDSALKSAAADGPVPWSPNPFRPMPPEPVPVNMPDLLWNIEQSIVNAFANVPAIQPFVREGFEAGFRVSQMIPWVNAVIPVVNIVGALPNLASGDPVVVRDATQSIINNLIVTIHPVSVVFYGYDEIADLINLEYEAQVLKEWFYTTAWNVLDPFALLHNRDQSGLPLSPSTTGATTQTVRLAASAKSLAPTGDEPLSNPFRPNDPDPVGMPQSLIDSRNLVMAFLPDEVDPIFRETFEFVYRASQMVPYVNAVIPITKILPALALALSGDTAAAQVAINELLLTTGPVSVLYYGYDQIADILNVEDAAFAAKDQLYKGLWDGLDPSGVLHTPGQSGL